MNKVKKIKQKREAKKSEIEIKEKKDWLSNKID